MLTPFLQIEEAQWLSKYRALIQTNTCLILRKPRTLRTQLEEHFGNEPPCDLRMLIG